MKREYRIACIGDKCVPQVRVKKKWLWGKWRKLVGNISGYSTYPLPDHKYSKTKQECEEIIDGHKASLDKGIIYYNYGGETNYVWV